MILGDLMGMCGLMLVSDVDGMGGIDWMVFDVVG